MRIGELAQTCGLTAKTIRFYESRGLLAPPPRTAGGYRAYPADAAGRLRFIRDGQSAGFTLAELRFLLYPLAVHPEGPPVTSPAVPPIPTLP